MRPARPRRARPRRRRPRRRPRRSPPRRRPRRRRSRRPRRSPPDVAAAERITVGGRTLRFTNGDKVLYPSTGTTKRDVLEYVLRASEPLIAHAGGRPVTRKRWVEGVGTEQKPGQVFFQKTLERGAPDWIQTVELQHSTGPKQYPVLSEPAALAWLAQMAAPELHVRQWRMIDGERKNPDELVLDLDPGPGADLDDCAQVALSVRELLEGIGLHPV